MRHEATWSNGKRTLTGRWRYEWARDRFIIHLDSIDKITGQHRQVVTYNDTPEWGKWKRVPKETIQ